MKSLKIFSVLCLAVMLVMGFSVAAHAAKSLEVGTDSVLNTGDESARTADLNIILKGGFDDVNGLAFTLLYDKDVFDFVGLADNTASLYDGDTYDYDNPPDEAAQQTIASSNIVYMSNNKPDEGRVLIAAAGANFLADDTNDVVPFVAQFRVKEGLGNGFYPINVQQTIIGPDTAQAAGYNVATDIPVAVGLDPSADPTTATAFAVLLPIGGGITVGGGYAISGSVQYADETDADGAVVRLFRNVDDNYFLNDSTTVSSGRFTFNAKPNGTYKLVVLATNPGFQKRYESGVITVAGAAYDAGTIPLAAYTPLTGKILVNGSAIPGVKAKVVDGTTLIGYFTVDAAGNFVTTPLDSSASYTITAVYGSEESASFTGDKDWSLDVGTLSGTISGLASGRNVMIHIMSANARLEKVLFKTAPSDVVYQFENLLPATDYIVSLVGDGIQVSYYDGVTSAGNPDINNAEPQTVTDGQDTSDIDFTLDVPVTTIEGQISEGETGIAGIPVFALETITTTPAMYSGFSGENGAYSLLVEDGNYIVFAYNNGKIFYYNSTGTTQVDIEAEQIAVSGSSVSGKDISLDEQDCAITGQVTYRRLGGDPVAGIMVMAEGPKGSAIDVTDENGNYTLSGLYNEEHNVTIYPNKPYPPQTESVDASLDGTVKDFVIHTGWVLSGAVTKEGDSNTKVNGAWVYLTNSSGMMQGVPAFTDIDGKFTLADIPSGIYALNAEHPDYQPKSVDMDIQADISGYELTMIQGASITGIVYDTDGNTPLGNVMIIATAVGDVAHYAFTNNDGEYEINGLVD